MVAAGVEESGVVCGSIAPIARTRRLDESKAGSNEIDLRWLPVQSIEEYRGSGENMKRACIHV